MPTTTITSFDRTLEKTNIWLGDLMKELAWQNEREKAYHALRVCLHVLRDRLPAEEVVDLGAQLPMLVRGFYYEGWSLSKKAAAAHRKESFLQRIADEFRGDPTVDPEQVARAVFNVISQHVTEGEIADIKGNLPAEIRNLWP